MAVIVFPLIAAAIFNLGGVRAVSKVDEEVVKTYKTKCMACHGPAAAKFYDPAMAEEEQIKVILEGKKGEKPPFMPGFEAKGMTPEEAKSLAEYMKQLRTPPEN